jgi:protein-S-isoprenylcysteine O-methyltransferase Ste14
VNSLFARALLAFLVCPGVVAFVVPLWLLTPHWGNLNWPGSSIVSLGIIVLLACVREFYRAGKGTLAPWSPPKHLVTSGLYRFSRNPMYVGVVVILMGWALAFRSRAHIIYALVVSVVFYGRVLFFEEPWLERTHGAAWRRYRAEVPRRFL